MTARTFKGKLADGKVVYVRRTKGDDSKADIAFAVYADVRGGGMTLVARFHTSPQSGERFSRCVNGYEHEGPCCWEATTGYAEESARWHAHWWTHVGHSAAEVVMLEPVAPR